MQNDVGTTAAVAREVALSIAPGGVGVAGSELPIKMATQEFVFQKYCEALKEVVLTD